MLGKKALNQRSTVTSDPIGTRVNGSAKSSAADAPGLQDSIQIKGEACCNHWQRTGWYAPKQRYAVSVPPDPRFPDAERFGVKLSCADMNLHYPEGSLVLCVPLQAVEGGIQVDQRYLIERRRRRAGAQEIELSVMTLITENGKRPIFVTESSDPTHRAVLPLFSDGNETILPVALVTGYVAPV